METFLLGVEAAMSIWRHFLKQGRKLVVELKFQVKEVSSVVFTRNYKLQLHHERSATQSEASAIFPLAHTWAHWCPRLVSSAVIDRRRSMPLPPEIFFLLIHFFHYVVFFFVYFMIHDSLMWFICFRTWRFDVPSFPPEILHDSFSREISERDSRFTIHRIINSHVFFFYFFNWFIFHSVMIRFLSNVIPRLISRIHFLTRDSLVEKYSTHNV